MTGASSSSREAGSLQVAPLEPRKMDKWSVAHCNVGWDGQAPRAFYFGRQIQNPNVGSTNSEPH